MPTKKVLVLLSKKSKLTVLSLICVLSSCLLFNSANAQTKTVQTVYVSVNYIKTQTGKQGEYLDLLKNYSKKIWESNFRQGRSFGTYVSTMILPSGASADYDISVITVSPDLAFLLDDSITQRVALRKLNPDYSDVFVQTIMDQYLQTRTLVKREIFEVVEEIDPAAPPTKYYTVDYMKTLPGKEDDYVKLEKGLWMPVHKERIKMGVLTDWILLAKMMPYSFKEQYDYETVNFISGLNFLTDSKYTEAAKKAFPNQDINKSFASTDSTRTLVKEELWKSVFFVDANNTKK